ncbi:PE-PPE domain-containing protein [Mycobacterium sp. SVM_VP21]|nr:PE-PPE domain-containing protein [Mycobacterium sp. SVM_VP21]
MSSTLRPYATAGVALVGAGLIAVSSVAGPSLAAALPAVQLTSTGGGYVVDSPNNLVGLIVGGSGMPLPQQTPGYVENMDELYIQRMLPGALSVPVFTPEGAQPIFSGIKSLPLDVSVAQGTAMVHQYVTDNVAAGNTVVVSGYSQSTAIAANLMTQLQDEGVPADAVKFLLTGAVTNPDGGLFERFGMTIPAFQTTFAGYAPPDTPYETSIYSLEYDGFADFPKYPLNILSVLNAELGELFVHPLYSELTAEQVDNAIQVGTTADYDGVTTYYMIPHDELPLLLPLRMLPVLGQPLADLLNPVLTQLVNLGYDNPNNDGWDEGTANVPTGFGIFPRWEQVMVALNNLGPAAEQGFNAFVQDINDLLSNPSSLFTGISDSGTAPTDLFSSPMDFINTLTGAFAQLYSLLLPAADSLTTLAITVPTQVANILLSNLDDPLTGLGLAAGTFVAGVTQVGAIELGTTVETLASVLGDFGISIPFLDEL